MYDTLDEQLRLCFDGTLKIVRDPYTLELKLWNEDNGIWVLVSDEFKTAYRGTRYLGKLSDGYS